MSISLIRTLLLVTGQVPSVSCFKLLVVVAFQRVSPVFEDVDMLSVGACESTVEQ